MTTENKDQEIAEVEVKTGDTHLATFDEIDKAIAELKGRFDGRVYVVKDDPEGMAVAKADRKEARAIRTGLEKDRKKFKKFYLDGGRAVDDAAKRLTTAVSEIEDPIDAIIKVEEQRIAGAKAEHLKNVQEFVETCRFELTEHCSVEQLSSRLAELNAIEIDKGYLKEAADLAATILEDALGVCCGALLVAQTREDAEAKRLADQKAEDERLAKEKARLDKEREEFRLEQEEKARKDKEKAEAEETERVRVQEIKDRIRELGEVSSDFQGMTSAQMALAIVGLEELELDDDLMEFREWAVEAVDFALGEMEKIWHITMETEKADTARKKEAERLAKQKAEQDEKENRRNMLNEIMEMAGHVGDDVTSEQVSGAIELIKEKSDGFDFGDLQQIAERSISGILADMEHLRLELAGLEEEAAKLKQAEKEPTAMRKCVEGDDGTVKEGTVLVSEVLQNTLDHAIDNKYPCVTMSFKLMERLIGLALETEKKQMEAGA